MGHRHRRELLLIGDEYDDDHDEITIKKGPWKPEEDEVLIHHVNKYGPRDWSSIRSKGLLRRTGKSCRLRWVNKLRPNLKNGVKFSVEEERVVMELQAQLGNKWARIASYLPGRTDNDVKNFWSSRQKRLARLLLKTPPPPPPESSKSDSRSREVAALSDVATDLEAPKLGSSTEEESSSKFQSCSSSSVDPNSQILEFVPLPDLLSPNLFSCDQNLFQLEFNPAKSINESQTQLIPFFPAFPVLQPDDDDSLAIGSHEIATRLGDPDFLQVFGDGNCSDLGSIAQFPLLPPYFGLGGGCQLSTDGRGEIGNTTGTPDSFFDDFPADVFDHLEPLPSPSEW